LGRRCRHIQQIVAACLADQAFLGRFLQLLDFPFAAQSVALARAAFHVHQRHGWTGMEETRASPALVGGEAPLGVVADAAIQGSVSGADQIDEPGFWRIGIHAAGASRREYRDVRTSQASARLALKCAFSLSTPPWQRNITPAPMKAFWAIGQHTFAVSLAKSIESVEIWWRF